MWTTLLENRELLSTDIATEPVENGFGHAQNCGEIKPIYEFQSIPSWCVDLH